MEKEFWLERWDMNQIGFHKNKFNDNLIDYFLQLNLNENDHILVPLCGKSKDMIWLAKQGLKVTGVELSKKAIIEFFKENNLDFTIEEVDGFKKYTSHNISIYEGDIFNLTSETLGKIDAIYDRASLVALPQAMREKFVIKLKELSLNLNMLVVLISYDQSLVQGPPFSVSEDFVYSNFSNFNMKKLKDKKIEAISAKFKEVKAEVFEKVFLIKNRD